MDCVLDDKKPLCSRRFDVVPAITATEYQVFHGSRTARRPRLRKEIKKFPCQRGKNGKAGVPSVLLAGTGAEPDAIIKSLPAVSTRLAEIILGENNREPISVKATRTK